MLTYFPIFTHSLFHATAWLLEEQFHRSMDDTEKRIHSNLFLFSSKNCVRDKPDDASSCTWQSSCSHTPSFFRKYSSLKREYLSARNIFYIKNRKVKKCESILLWDCFRILSASPVSCSCCPDPSPLHFAWWCNISYILPWLHFLVFRWWNIFAQYLRCQLKHKRISYL